MVKKFLEGKWRETYFPQTRVFLSQGKKEIEESQVPREKMRGPAAPSEGGKAWEAERYVLCLEMGIQSKLRGDAHMPAESANRLLSGDQWPAEQWLPSSLFPVLQPFLLQKLYWRESISSKRERS